MERITEYLIRPTVTQKGTVRAWKEVINLPTYAIGKEEKNPIFLEKRVYQGSSGVVYPYPVVEKVEDEKHDRPYLAYFLENEYLKIMVLPELGGRVQMAYDKVRKRHFVYYNQVVKPALVGLTGPWISGGIEFNWPQHHRPSTFLPTDCLIEDHQDGSKTLWCNEVERMFGLKGMQGFTLRPGKSYLEIRVKVYNRTSFPQTFLWWANPAVVVNDNYYSVFPPDVHAVFDHGKRDVSNFPIATGVYYRQDYSQGVDISKYKNIPVPTSYMAVKSRYDFVGGYEEQVNAGLLHVADHHLSPGKKQWTWGCGDFGKAWDRNLTDEDGPYIELMTGVYTDNQPDFSWLQPYEEKSWTQYFMPYAEVGYVKNASKDFVMNLEVVNGKATVVVYATGERTGITVRLSDEAGKTWLEQVVALSPERSFRAAVEVGSLNPEQLILQLSDSRGRELLSYQADKPEINPVPEPAKAARLPEEIASIEQLFLTGQHLEQYRHATYNPLDYYEEALRREPSDIRCNNAVGLLLLRRGKFAEAESYFRRAIETLTERNPNPYDGEPYYNLGRSLKMQYRYDEAYDAFYKSTWNAAWQDAGYLGVAQIDCIRGDWELALQHIDLSLVRNWHNHKTRQLKASILRYLGRETEALEFIADSLHMDGFNLGCRLEHYFITGREADLEEMKQILSGTVFNYMEYAFDFADAGLYAEASRVMEVYLKDTAGHPYPMAVYMQGYFASRQGRYREAEQWYREAAALPSDYCFPNRVDEVNVLQDALDICPDDYKAFYYLGNFWYAHRRYEEAVECWEKSVSLNSQFPTSLRNLALAYYNKLNRKQEARQLLEKAFGLDPTDARLFMELDQLYKKMGCPHAERLALMEQHRDLVEQRDDLCIERVTLYNLLGRYEKARQLIDSRRFHPWEGGEGKITGQYVICRVELAKRAIAGGRFAEALSLLKETDVYPDNLGEGKLINAEENEVDYYKGVAYDALGNREEAVRHFQKATQGLSEPRQAFYYNDQQPDRIFYQGLAWRALGNESKARGRFNQLIDHGRKHLFDHCRIDYFAVSLPELAIWEDDLEVRNRIHCYYVMALGYSGLGQNELAEEYYAKVKALDVNKQMFKISLG